jgi:hypothetical protein
LINAIVGAGIITELQSSILITSNSMLKFENILNRTELLMLVLGNVTLNGAAKKFRMINKTTVVIKYWKYWK